MKKYIIGDARSGFLSDINTSMLLDGFPFDVKTAKSFDEVAAFAASDKAAIIVINDNLLDSFDSTMLDGRTVYEPRKAGQEHVILEAVSGMNCFYLIVSKADADTLLAGRFAPISVSGDIFWCRGEASFPVLRSQFRPGIIYPEKLEAIRVADNLQIDWS